MGSHLPDTSDDQLGDPIAMSTVWRALLDNPENETLRQVARRPLGAKEELERKKRNGAESTSFFFEVPSVLDILVVFPLMLLDLI